MSAMNQTLFAHKTALVTGACGGLGRAIAEAFLRAGANVVVADINAELIADFKEKVSAAYPECTLVLQADITKDENVEKMFTEGEKMFGGIDLVVNSAGRIDRFDAVAEMERQMWDKVIALNLTAPAMISGRAIRKWLEEGKKGSVVNIASIAGFRGFTCGMLAQGGQSRGQEAAIVSERVSSLTVRFRRRGIHRKQTRSDRPHEEHCCILRRQRHPLQRRRRWPDGHQHRAHALDRGLQPGRNCAHEAQL